MGLQFLLIDPKARFHRVVSTGLEAKVGVVIRVGISVLHTKERFRGTSHIAKQRKTRMNLRPSISRRIVSRPGHDTVSM